MAKNKCDECGEEFGNAGALASHEKTHEESNVADKKKDDDKIVVGTEKDKKADGAGAGQAATEPVTRTDVVAVDDEGNEYIEAPEGGQFGDDGETNYSRTLQPDEANQLSPEGMTGVDPDYPPRATRGAALKGDKD